MKDLKQWRCKCERILGYISKNGNDVAQLMILRQPLDMAAEMPAEVDLIGPLTGSISIRCTCGRSKLWAASVETVLAQFESLTDKQAYEFWMLLLERAKAPSPAEVRDGASAD